MAALRGAKRPKSLEGGAADGVSGQSSGLHLVGHGIAVSREATLSPIEAEYERARRCLVYADMIAKTGSIQWPLLAVWSYQPTHQDVLGALTEVKGGKFHNRKGSRLVRMEAMLPQDDGDDDNDD